MDNSEMPHIRDEMPVLSCWSCEGGALFRDCAKCGGTGSVFWVNGRAYPYTPTGERVARSAAST